MQDCSAFSPSGVRCCSISVSASQQNRTATSVLWLTATQVKKWKYRQIEETHVSPWEQHSHPFTRHIDVSRSHIVHLDRAGFSTSFLMRPGQLFRPNALPCLLFYGRRNVNPSSVSLYAAFFGSWPRFEHISPWAFRLLPPTFSIFHLPDEPRPAC